MSPDLRQLSARDLPAVGIGCMNLSHAYGEPPDDEDGARVLHRALELGVRHFDTAALYGFGRNETLLGNALAPHRDELFLASKCGMTGVDGKRVIDGRPETLRRTLEDALARLRTDFIDLYYLHRWDRAVPIEDSVGTLGALVREGKIGAVGLSEVSAPTLRRAHAEFPIAAVQSEYSLWSREPEIAVLAACRELGTAFVAFSPLARGFLADASLRPEAFVDGDIRRAMPRFQEPNFARNDELRSAFARLAGEAGCSMAQLALAWVLAQGEHVHVIPGTTSREHLAENWGAQAVDAPADLLRRLDRLFEPSAVSGPRYGAATLSEIDTESFTFA